MRLQHIQQMELFDTLKLLIIYKPINPVGFCDYIISYVFPLVNGFTKKIFYFFRQIKDGATHA